MLKAKGLEGYSLAQTDALALRDAALRTAPQGEGEGCLGVAVSPSISLRYRVSRISPGLRARLAAGRGSPMSETRKIAAILVADVVGYSRLAGADEDRTLSRLRGLRSDLIDPAIAAHHGRIVKRTGDGSLVEFRSVVDAVHCAIEVQTGLIERNAGVPDDRRIVFRIGMHLGDVVEESRRRPDGRRRQYRRAAGGYLPSRARSVFPRTPTVRCGARLRSCGHRPRADATQEHRGRCRSMRSSRGGAREGGTYGARGGKVCPPRLSIVVLPFPISAATRSRTIRRWRHRKPDDRPLAHSRHRS